MSAEKSRDLVFGTETALKNLKGSFLELSNLIYRLAELSFQFENDNIAHDNKLGWWPLYAVTV